MTEHRDQIVRRVVHSLEVARDPDSLVWSYFDEDRDVVIEAARQTLEATREDSSYERVSAAVDRELIEALRFPPAARSGLPAAIYIHRVPVMIGTVMTVLGALASLLLL